MLHKATVNTKPPYTVTGIIIHKLAASLFKPRGSKHGKKVAAYSPEITVDQCHTHSDTLTHTSNKIEFICIFEALKSLPSWRGAERAVCVWGDSGPSSCWTFY